MSTLVTALIALFGAFVLYWVFSFSVVLTLFKAAKELEEAEENATKEK
jgi:hypothetical protein